MAEPRHANYELTPDGIKVWRTFKIPAAAFRGIAVLEQIEEAGFAPLPVPVEPVLVPPDIAAAMIRDRAIATDDDLGPPGEPPRCATGGCGDE